MIASRHRQRLAELDAVVDTSIAAIQCPACLGPVFAPGDSDGERIDCLHCEAKLVTYRDIAGVTARLVETRSEP